MANLPPSGIKVSVEIDIASALILLGVVAVMQQNEGIRNQVMREAESMGLAKRKEVGRRMTDPAMPLADVAAALAAAITHAFKGEEESNG